MAAGDPQTAEAGAALLRNGGNAVDAAVAAAFASFVCELPLGSPLGGGVAVVERGADGAVAFDMFARTPGLGRGLGTAAQRDFDGVTVSFGAAKQTFHVGRASVAVPLALPGLIEIHRRFGTRPLSEVLAPAISLGRDGFVLGPGVAYVFDILVPIVRRTPECMALFVDPETGAIARTGARLFNRDMARTFESIASDPAGAVAHVHALLTECFSPNRGGLITPEDIQAEAIAELSPITIHHRGYRLATMPSPSTGGALVALGVRMLEGVSDYPFLSAAHLGLVARAQEAMIAERSAGDFAERCKDPTEIRAMLDDARIAEARAHARRNLLGSTTHISALDEHGVGMSLTLTNGEGSGHVLEGTGMIANNLLGEEDLHPRGFHQDAPRTPLRTMMAPTILSRGVGEEADLIALGSGGSNRLRTAILQVIVGLLEYGVSAEDAVRAPRLHVEPGPLLAFEAAGLTPDVVTALKRAYGEPPPAVFDAPNLYFGGVHLALRKSGVFSGYGDPRRGGARAIV